MDNFPLACVKQTEAVNTVTSKIPVVRGFSLSMNRMYTSHTVVVSRELLALRKLSTVPTAVNVISL